MPETPEHRVKRLYMRSIRRGIKEMDLILTVYASDRLDQMDDTTLTLYDAMLSENDHDLYQWITRQVETPDPYGALIADIQNHIANTAD
ncbi:MAG: succinate dehydrogenase assembly factor 2 [Sulfitobacter sp.]